MSSTEDTHEGPRRRRSPFAVASVAAAVLVAGGGTYFATAGFGGGHDSADTKSGAPGHDGDPPPLAVDGRTKGGDRGGIAPGEPDPSGGGVVYKAGGKLPAGPDEAAVHRTKGTVTAAEVTLLAKALGLPGTPRLVGPAWKIGADKDGAGPLLQVNRQAPGTWTFARFLATPGGDNCLKGKECPARGGTSPSGGSPVSEEAAKKAASPVLKALGQSDADLDARQLMGAVRVVNADPLVDGLPTYGWTTGIQVGADGQVVGGSGQLKKPEKSDEYPVISAQEALKQLNKDSRSGGTIGIGGCATPVPLEGEQKPDTPCAPKRVKGPEQLTVTKAVFGLAAQSVEGQQALVPSWLFEVRPKGGAQPFTVTQLAVDPKYLKESVPPKQDIRPTEPQQSPPVRSDRRIESYTVSGRTLALTFWGGVCSDYAAKAGESGSAVTVRIVETNPDPDRVCIAIAKEITVKVTLDKPLGDRKVVDAATGEAVPARPVPAK
ncbi:hypothetical protein FBY35_5474 [Streptomyces sp. SLBN-118]|uniref:hypothetical protein n=1 Tax=Streptomyces sp. SLBN-118 TaxID=2768454 RepID=UPI001153CAE5|nr:hypothetical protein [Streptomyces sp. SLBN-118]TQK43997.1 hypothetical protein FBY35_5474 [Streptomyces sp. SLBN-118]